MFVYVLNYYRDINVLSFGEKKRILLLFFDNFCTSKSRQMEYLNIGCVEVMRYGVESVTGHGGQPRLFTWHR
jgi:hypothetical protein